jgi:SRSO17 transposase
MIESGIKMDDFCLDSRPLTGILRDYLPLEITIVNKTELEPLWDYMVRKYHYLGYETMIGPRIKYLIRYQGTPIAALSYNRAALGVGVRDAYIGWKAQQKKVLLKHVMNNNRFLILPWVKVKNLASHLLSRTLKTLKHDWYELFGVEPYLVETFVDTDKYKGTCYQAANWIYLGETRGFAKIGKAFVYHGHRKGVYIYELNMYELNKKLRQIVPSVPAHRTLKPKRERVPNMMLHTPDWSPDILEQAGITTEEVLGLGSLLDNYLAIFQECYSRSDQRNHGETFVKGLLSNLERKSIEPIALEYTGPKGVRPMQIFFKDSPIKDDLMLQLYQRRLASAISGPNGMINTDGSDFVKKGKDSVGVSRQYCGVLGKVENCQAGVFVGYSSDRGYGLIDRRLYMPKAWFGPDYADLREECKVPRDLQFKTKVELALEMIKQTIASGLFPARWIGCDSFFGRNKEFLASLPEEYCYFADIPENIMVWLEMPTVSVPEYNGHGKRSIYPRASSQPVPISQIAKDENIPWQRVFLGEGAKGPIIADVKCLRIVEAIKGEPANQYLPYQEVWLYIRKFADGKIKYAFSNAPANIKQEALDQAATKRWPIEQCFEECKSYLGMGHYETRSWTAWHRHMLFVFIAHLFTIELRLMFKKNSNSDYATS